VHPDRLGPRPARAHVRAHQAVRLKASKWAVDRGRRGGAAAAAGRADAALLRPNAGPASASRAQARLARDLRAQGGAAARRGHLRGRARGRAAPRDLHGHCQEPRQVPTDRRLWPGRALLRKGLLAFLQRRVARGRPGALKASGTAACSHAHPSTRPLCHRTTASPSARARAARRTRASTFCFGATLPSTNHLGYCAHPLYAPCRAQGVPDRAAPRHPEHVRQGKNAFSNPHTRTRTLCPHPFATS